MGGGNLGTIIKPWDESRRYNPYDNYTNKHGFYVISYYNYICDRNCKPRRMLKIGVATTKHGINQRFRSYYITYGDFNVIQVRTFDQKAGEGEYFNSIKRANNYETEIKRLLKNIALEDYGTERFDYKHLREIKDTIQYYDNILSYKKTKPLAREVHLSLVGRKVKDKKWGNGEIVKAEKYQNGSWMWHVSFKNGHKEPFGLKRIEQMLSHNIG